MTNEQVNEYEKLLREAEKLCEKAGRMVCSIPGRADVWSKCVKAGEACADAIHESYKLRH